MVVAIIAPGEISCLIPAGTRASDAHLDGEAQRAGDRGHRPASDPAGLQHAERVQLRGAPFVGEPAAFHGFDGLGVT